MHTITIIDDRSFEVLSAALKLSGEYKVKPNRHPDTGLDIVLGQYHFDLEHPFFVKRQYPGEHVQNGKIEYITTKANEIRVREHFSTKEELLARISELEEQIEMEEKNSENLRGLVARTIQTLHSRSYTTDDIREFESEFELLSKL